MDELEERIVSRSATDEEEKIDYTLRPQSLDEFVGQEKLKENLKIFVAAAKKRKEPLDHCLFYSPPGLGKTTLANIIAHEMGVNIKSTSGPVMEKVGDLAAILTNLSYGDVFFIDEIHRLNRVVEESLYPVMEDFKLDIIIGQGPSAKTIKLDIPKFTLIGATTRAGLLTSPLRERFGISAHIDFYSVDNLKDILVRSAKILNIKFDRNGVELIAKRSRGTPRIANRLLRRIRDFADMKTQGVVTEELAELSLKSLGIDSDGLDDTDRKILFTIIEKFSGGPVGVETIAVAISEETDTVTDVYEPYLIQAGFLARTSRGRIVTELAYKHLGISHRRSQQELL
ncbi:MAG: Holliday junction branch migration DNA helicase RuvB [Elusimicrobiota bacterium]